MAARRPPSERELRAMARCIRLVNEVLEDRRPTQGSDPAEPSQGEVGADLGIDQSIISQIETKKVSAERPQKLGLRAILGVMEAVPISPDWFFADEAPGHHSAWLNRAPAAVTRWDRAVRGYLESTRRPVAPPLRRALADPRHQAPCDRGAVRALHGALETADEDDPENADAGG